MHIGSYKPNQNYKNKDNWTVTILISVIFANMVAQQLNTLSAMNILYVNTGVCIPPTSSEASVM